MKLKAKYFESPNKFIKFATIVLTLIIIITGILNLNIQSSMKYNQIFKMMVDKIIKEIPSSVRTQLYNVEKENVKSVPSDSDKYSSLASSLNQNYEEKNQNLSETLHYRKRRYLQFPEGSSLQLVFNILLPIIDYTNYAILGITCALAFELPSKPLSELEDELLTELHKDSHGLSSQKHLSLDPKYNDKNHHQNQNKEKLSNLIYIHPLEYTYQNSYEIPELYLDRNKNIYKNYIPGPYSPTYNQHNSKNSKFDAGKPFDSFWKPNYSKSSYIRRQDEIPKRKDHAVYHIMGKRSIKEINPSTVEIEENNSWLNKLDQIHLRYHRSSRHELYSKLETMLDRQGKNGTECILRALCETGNRRHETKPGELLTEIFRAVFTLPKDLEIKYHKNYLPVHKARDDAHWNQQNCSKAYPFCENFIWDGNFRI